MPGCLSRYLLVLSLLGVHLLGCGGSQSRQVQAPPLEDVLPRAGDLVDLVPEGAQLLVWARPRVLWDSPVFLPLLNVLVDGRSRLGFERHTGVDVTQVDQVLMAEYGEGVFWWLRGFASAGIRARQAVGRVARSMDDVQLTETGPWFRRVGRVGLHVFDVGLLDGDTLCSGWGVLREGEALARRVREGGWPAGTGALFETNRRRRWMEQAMGAPLALVIPGRLQLPADTGVGLLLGGVEGLVVTLQGGDHEGDSSSSPSKDGTALLDVSVRMFGRFPSTIEGNLLTLLKSLGGTPLGVMLGLQQARVLATEYVGAAEYTEDETAMIRFVVPSDGFAHGLKMLLGADLQSIFQN